MGKLIDMTGQKFSRLTVLSRDTSHKKDKNTYWLCECDCGTKLVVSRNSLVSDNTRSCGCLQKEYSEKYIDLTGQIFGRLVVLKRSNRRTKINRIIWECKCSCGNIKEVPRASLIHGKTQSCGCLHRDSMKKNILPNCGSGKNKLYKQYKKLAIKKGRTFELTFDKFIEITQQDCYYCGAKPRLAFKIKPNSPPYIYNGIDRVDNNKGYSIENCVTCCSTCNYAKRDMTKEQFLNWIHSVYTHTLTKIIEEDE